MMHVCVHETVPCKNHLARSLLPLEWARTHPHSLLSRLSTLIAEVEGGEPYAAVRVLDGGDRLRERCLNLKLVAFMLQQREQRHHAVATLKIV